MFTESKDDGGDGDNWTTGTIILAKLASQADTDTAEDLIRSWTAIQAQIDAKKDYNSD